MKKSVLCLVLAVWGCSSSSNDEGGAGGVEADRGIVSDMGQMDIDGSALTDGGSGGTGGGGGGGEEPIDDRCPDAQAGTYLLVAFSDRVDAYRQRDFGAVYFCKFLDLAGNGINAASGLAVDRNGERIFVVQPEENQGSVYEFDVNGSFVGRVSSNVNLDGVEGLWNTFGDAFVAWSRTSQNLYELDSNGRFRQPFSPPVARGSRVEGVTDLLFLDQESILMTFNNRSAQLYKTPFAPEFPDDEVGPGNALAPVETDEGVKILMTAQIGGEGNAYGVAFYAAAESGRAPPERERILVDSTNGDFVDGIDIIALPTGFLLLDSNLAGTAKITSYNAQGEQQISVPVEGGGNPYMFTKARIFPDF